VVFWCFPGFDGGFGIMVFWWAGPPGALPSPGVLVGAGHVIRALLVGVALFLGNGKGRISTPSPRQDEVGFVLDIGV
jgi:hypothetical protein